MTPAIPAATSAAAVACLPAPPAPSSNSDASGDGGCFAGIMTQLLASENRAAAPRSKPADSREASVTFLQMLGDVTHLGLGALGGPGDQIPQTTSILTMAQNADCRQAQGQPPSSEEKSATTKSNEETASSGLAHKVEPSESEAVNLKRQTGNGSEEAKAPTTGARHERGIRHATQHAEANRAEVNNVGRQDSVPESETVAEDGDDSRPGFLDECTPVAATESDHSPVPTQETMVTDRRFDAEALNSCPASTAPSAPSAVVIAPPTQPAALTAKLPVAQARPSGPSASQIATGSGSAGLPQPAASPTEQPLSENRAKNMVASRHGRSREPRLAGLVHVNGFNIEADRGATEISMPTAAGPGAPQPDTSGFVNRPPLATILEPRLPATSESAANAETAHTLTANVSLSMPHVSVEGALRMAQDDDAPGASFQEPLRHTANNISAENTSFTQSGGSPAAPLTMPAANRMAPPPLTQTYIENTKSVKSQHQPLPPADTSSSKPHSATPAAIERKVATPPAAATPQARIEETESVESQHQPLPPAGTLSSKPHSATPAAIEHKVATPPAAAAPQARIEETKSVESQHQPLPPAGTLNNKPRSATPAAIERKVATPPAAAIPQALIEETKRVELQHQPLPPADTLSSKPRSATPAAIERKVATPPATATSQALIEETERVEPQHQPLPPADTLRSEPRSATPAAIEHRVATPPAATIPQALREQSPETTQPPTIIKPGQNLPAPPVEPLTHHRASSEPTTVADFAEPSATVAGFPTLDQPVWKQGKAMVPAVTPTDNPSADRAVILKADFLAALNSTGSVQDSMPLAPTDAHIREITDLMPDGLAISQPGSTGDQLQRGTHGATHGAAMKAANNLHAIADLAENILPGDKQIEPILPDGEKPFGIRIGDKLNLSILESLTTTREPAMAAQQIAPASIGTMEGAVPASASTATSRSLTEVLAGQALDHAVRFKSQGHQDMAVVLRPDAHTEIHLQFSHEENRVDCRAWMERGDFEVFRANWGQLQQTLANHGVHMGALDHPASYGNTASRAAATGGDAGANDPTAHHKRRDDDWEEELAGGGAMTEPLRAHMHKVRHVTPRRWEKWA